MLVTLFAQAIFCVTVADEYNRQIVLKRELTIYFSNSERRNNLSWARLASGLGVRNKYLLDSGRRKSPHLRGKNLLRFHL